MSLQDWANSRPKGVSFEQFHADSYRSERHAALDASYPSDVCCTGACTQGRTCPRYSRPTESSWRYSDLAVAAILVLFLGLWASGVIA